MLPEDYNEATTSNPRYVNIANQGFHTHPERINRAGRPLGSRNRKDIVKEALEAILEGGEQMVVDAITAAAIAKAMTGDIPAFKELMDSGYGKIADKQELSGPNGEPLQAIVRKVIDPKIVDDNA